ncbi:hypothetical protein V6Z11_A05G027600 [Gossypium hirsutum]
MPLSPSTITTRKMVLLMLPAVSVEMQSKLIRILAMGIASITKRTYHKNKVVVVIIVGDLMS